MRTDLNDNMGAAGGQTNENNSPSYSKDFASPLPGEEATPVGRTATSGFELNPTSVALGAPTPARNSGAGKSGPSQALAAHSASIPVAPEL